MGGSILWIQTIDQYQFVKKHFKSTGRKKEKKPMRHFEQRTEWILKMENLEMNK